MGHLKRVGAIAVATSVVSVSLIVPAYGEEALDPAAKAAAASAYLAMVCPANAANDRYNAAGEKAERAGMKEGSTIPPYLVKALRQKSKAYARFARQLMSYQWPSSDLTWDAKQLAEILFRDAGELGFIASGKEWRNPDAGGHSYASRMRLTLGLPPIDQGCPKK